MSSTTTSTAELEIVELTTGEIVLRRSGRAEGPIVSIRFSDEARNYLGRAVTDVGRAMIGAGVEMAGEIYDQTTAITEQDVAPNRVLH